MRIKKTGLLLIGIAISFLTANTQVPLQASNRGGYKHPAPKLITDADKNREFPRSQRKQRVNDKRKIRKENKLNKKMEALMLRMTGGVCFYTSLNNIS